MRTLVAALIALGCPPAAAAEIEPGTLMNGEVQGQKFELRTKVTGRRVGACKG